MNDIVPRWEWRTFARQIEPSIDLATHAKTRHVVSSELYLVVAGSDANPKIRDDKMDIKRLQRVDEDGLQQWKPVMKADFPLSAATLAEVHRLLALPPPREARDNVAFDDFVAMMKSTEGVCAVRVDKVRDLYEIDGCIVETAEVAFDGDPYRTLAAEDPDPNRVLVTINALGLAGRENTSYVKFIKALTLGAS